MEVVEKIMTNISLREASGKTNGHVPWAIRKIYCDLRIFFA